MPHHLAAHSRTPVTRHEEGPRRNGEGLLSQSCEKFDGSLELYWIAIEELEAFLRALRSLLGKGKLTVNDLPPFLVRLPVQRFGVVCHPRLPTSSCLARRLTPCASRKASHSARSKRLRRSTPASFHSPIIARGAKA